MVLGEPARVVVLPVLLFAVVPLMERPTSVLSPWILVQC